MNKLILVTVIIGGLMIGQRILQFILKQSLLTIVAWIIIGFGLWAGIALIRYARRAQPS